ncbi:MAG TPA: chloride channel protein, partial [Actinomycetes bacterium]|nr:chloride channel protein [Actinomycetes bacterium]
MTRQFRSGVGAATLSVRSGSSGLVVVAVLVGAGAGLGAVVFRWLIERATWVFTGRLGFASAFPGDHAAHPWLPWLGAGFLVLAPAVGGLVQGPLVERFAPEARGHGVPEVMYAVSRRGGRIPGRVAVVKALASAVCIGSGGSVGREGPIVQIGAALGSSLGRIARLPEARLRTLVACGAAGGIAATFNAPIAGVFFALELLLRDFAAESFGAVVLAAVTASVAGRAAFGDTPFLRLPAFSLTSPWEYLLYATLGLAAGAAGVLFTRVLYGVEDICDRLWRGARWARPAVGGLLLGGVLLALPQMYGVGYPVLSRAVHGRYALAFLLVLLLGKMLATSLTIGIGGSGGVFAPTLFCGAMLGAAFGDVAVWLLPGTAGSVGAYALVGMGAVFAGAARAPITAVLILFELTGEYSIILPLMLAIVLATGVSKALSRDTVYTLKLRRRGVDVDAPVSDHRLGSAAVSGVMAAPPPTLDEGDPMSLAAAALLGSAPVVPVVRTGPEECSVDAVVGVLTAREVSESLADEPGGTRAVGEVATMPPYVRPNTSLARALEVLMHSDSTGVPVLDDDDRLCGWLTHQALLRAVSATPGRSVRAEPRAR